jgi:hypothetical protein
MRFTLFVLAFCLLLPMQLAAAMPALLGQAEGFAAVSRSPIIEVRRKRHSHRRALARKRAAERSAESAQGGDAPPLPPRRSMELASAEDWSGIPPTPERREANVELGPPLGPPPPPPEWSAEEIAEADAACNQLLKDVPAVYEKLEPIREGVCGDPAPILLKGFGSTPALEIRPPATMNCKLAAALWRWFNAIVQPSAKELLQATIIRMSDASAYVCRTRYNNPEARMSEHAFGDAFDVGQFLTAKGERISVLDGWGASDETGQFLRDIHDGACGVFGTTLGPDANSAHRGHFHLDMTPRRHGGLCDFTAAQRRQMESEAHPIMPAAAPMPEKRLSRSKH